MHQPAGTRDTKTRARTQVRTRVCTRARTRARGESWAIALHWICYVGLHSAV
jgi:hypothetical protein